MAVSITQYGGLLTVLSTDKNIYRPGEPVRISMFKMNIAPRPIALLYPTTQRYDFSVAAFTGEVWRWSHDKVFAQFTQTVTLLPGQTLSYAETWPQLDVAGDRVMPGIYRVTGWNTFAGYERFFWPATYIRIGI